MRAENKYLLLGNSIKFSLRAVFFYIVLYMYSMLMKVWLFFFPAKVTEKKYYISICSCFKDEAPNLKEWIEYHKLVGVDHFYLYNNNSTDNFREVLAPYIDEGSVTLIDFPRVPIQPYCYEHCINNYSEETSWLALTDIDEYFVPLKEDNLKDWLKKREKYPVILIYWKMFGTSGKLNHDSSQLITEQYVVSWPKLYDCGKIVFNTDYKIETNMVMHHHSTAKKNGIRIAPVNTWGKFVLYGINRGSKKDADIQLNHYWSGAYSKYIQKQGKGDSAFTNFEFKNFSYFLAHEQCNTSIDMSIYRFMAQLKLKMIGEYPESK